MNHKGPKGPKGICGICGCDGDAVSLTNDERVALKRALNFYSQFVFEQGIYKDADGKESIKAENVKLLETCDAVFEKLVLEN